MQFVGDHHGQQEVLSGFPLRFRHIETGGDVVARVCGFFIEVGVVPIQRPDHGSQIKRRVINGRFMRRPQKGGTLFRMGGQCKIPDRDHRGGIIGRKGSGKTVEEPGFGGLDSLGRQIREG